MKSICSLFSLSLIVHIPLLLQVTAKTGSGLVRSFHSPSLSRQQEPYWLQRMMRHKRENELDGWQVFTNKVTHLLGRYGTSSPYASYSDDPRDLRRYRKKVLQAQPLRRTMLCALLKFVIENKNKE